MSHWGRSPGIDILEVIESCKNDKMEAAQKKDFSKMHKINILLLGNEDPRHILTTLGEWNKERSLDLDFYLHGPYKEIVARQILLLAIAFESPDILCLPEKTHIFMEIFGNTLIRKETANYLRKKSAELLDLLSCPSVMKETMPMFDLRMLKETDIEVLQLVFKFWADPDNSFDSTLSWRKRLHKNLRRCFEIQEDVFDFEYQMKILPFGGHIINPEEYRYWRGHGVAFFASDFEILSNSSDNKYYESNPTMASHIMRDASGELICHDIFGDIGTGPFIAFASKYPNPMNSCESASQLTEINLSRIFSKLVENSSDNNEGTNGSHGMKRKIDRTSDNQVVDIVKDVMETILKEIDKNGSEPDLNIVVELIENIFEEIEVCHLEINKCDNNNIKIEQNSEHSDKYDSSTEDANFKWSKTPQIKENVQSSVPDKILNNNLDLNNQVSSVTLQYSDYSHQLISINKIKIIILKPGFENEVVNNSTLKKVFDVVILSTAMFHLFRKKLISLASDGALLILENRKLVLGIKETNLTKFAKTLKQRAAALGCSDRHRFSPSNDYYATFRVNEENAVPGDIDMEYHYKQPLNTLN